MKRVWKYILLLILIIPFQIKAEGIENFYVNATLKKNGDLLVEEYFNLTGKYNGFERIIDYRNLNTYEFDPNLSSYGGSSIHNGDNVILHEIRALKKDPNFNFSNINGNIFKEVSSANKGDYGVYTKSEKINGNTYLIYLPSRKEKAFYVKYTIKNIAILHNDYGEIGWNIIGNSLRENITNFKAYVNFPNNQKELRGWAHGPLQGEIKIVNNQKIEVNIHNLNAYRGVDVRALFDKEIINDSSKRTNVEALDKVLKYETDKAEQANYERENEEKKKEIKAENELINFEKNIKRYQYEFAQKSILRINDKEKREELLERLSITERKLIKIEEEEAKKSVKDAKKYNKYFWYKSALDKISVLQESKLKTNLLKEMELVKKVIEKEERKLEKQNYTKGTILLTVILSIIIFIYIKYDKEFTSKFKHKYYREIPNDYHPTKVSYLFKRKITNAAFSASILDLIEKKFVRYKKIDDKNYILYNDSKKFNNMSRLEKNLIKLIFDNKMEVELKELKKYAKNNYTSFASNWKVFNENAVEEAKIECFYEKDKTNKNDTEKIKKYKHKRDVILGVGILCSIYFFPILITTLIYYLYATIKIKTKDTQKNLCILILIICILIGLFININTSIYQNFVKTSIWYMWLIILLSFISIFYCLCAIKKTEKGINEYAKWKAFKRFLKDFGTFDIKQLPEIELWEKYLVYATVLGCADNLAKVMKVKVEELNINDTIDLVDLASINYINKTISKNLTNCVNTAVKKQHSVEASKSNYSSSSGGGGGFSSGGGSFGGGGGGGRF